MIGVDLISRERVFIGVCVLIFLVLAGPWIFNFVFYFPDEVYYTDCPWIMLETGDFITPYQTDHIIRFKKPIFTYWAVVASYLMFGLKEWSSRLPFLLGGLFSAWLSWKMVSEFFGRQKDGWQVMGFVLMLFNVYVILASSQCLTDIFLMMWITAYLYGFMGVWKAEGISRRHQWWIYLGGGFAVMTKGIPALVFFGMAWLFLQFNPWRRVSFRQIWNTPAVLVGLVIGLFWYGMVYQIHGLESIQEFYRDQLGGRMNPTPLKTLGYFVAVAFGPIWMFLPWSLILIPYARSKSLRQKIWRKPESRAFWVLAGLMTLVMILSTTWVNLLYMRYMMPVFPVVIACYYHLWLEVEQQVRHQYLRLSAWILSIALLVVVVVGMFHSWVMGYEVWRWVSLIALGLAYVVIISRCVQWQWRKVVLGLVFLISSAFFTTYLLVAPMSIPGHGKQISATLERLYIKPDQDLAIYGEPKISSRLRLGSHGKYSLLTSEFPQNARDNADVMIFGARDREKFDLTGYEVVIASRIWGNLNYGRMIDMRRNGEDPMSLIEESKEVYFIAYRSQ